MANKTVTVKTSGGTYTTLAAAIVGERADLSAADYYSGGPGILNIDIQDALLDTTQVDIDGYTTTADYYINIYTSGSARPTGIWSTSAYRLVTDNADCVYLRENYVRIDGLQFGLSGTISAERNTIRAISITSTSNDVRVSNCVFTGHTNASYNWRPFGFGQKTQWRVWNCVFYKFPAKSTSYINLVGDADETLTLYNCTIIGNDTLDIGLRREAGVLTAYNTYVAGGSIGAFYGDMSGDYNASDDTTADTKFGTGINNIAVNTTNFTNVTGGSEDFSLPLGSGLIGQGTDNPGSGLYSIDIAGATRTSTWDIGAFEYIAAIAQFARPSSDVAGGTFRSILVTAPFGPRVIA